MALLSAVCKLGTALIETALTGESLYMQPIYYLNFLTLTINQEELLFSDDSRNWASRQQIGSK